MEFRIADYDSILKLYETDPRKSDWVDTPATYFGRRASDDPRDAQSWYGLLVSHDAKEGEPPTSLWTDVRATIIMGDLTVHVPSGRFQHTDNGGYVWSGPDIGGDPSFAFGTCRPYYD